MTQEFSLHEKIKQLESIEEYFQRPDMDLEQAIAKQQEAVVLAKEILAYLEKAENSLATIDIQALRKETLN